jgi:hypothetical protein
MVEVKSGIGGGEIADKPNYEFIDERPRLEAFLHPDGVNINIVCSCICDPFISFVSLFLVESNGIENSP